MNAARTHTDPAAIRAGRVWLFSDGARVPFVGGADETAEPSDVTVPEDLTTIDPDELAALDEQVLAEFDRLLDEGSTDIAQMTALAEAHERIKAENTRRDDEDAELARQREELAARVHAPAEAEATDAPDPENPEDGGDGGDDPGDGAPDTTPAPDGATATPDREPVTAAAGTPVSAPAAAAPRPRASASATARRSARPNVQDRTDRVTITAAADIPGVAAAAHIDLDTVAASMHNRARALSNNSGRVPVATFHLPYPAELDARGRLGVQAGGAWAVMDRASDQAQWQHRAENLVAAGGWCTPSVNMYDLISYDGATGLLNLPSVGIDRGGINVPGYIEIDAADDSLWVWSEDQDSGVVLSFTDIDIASNVATGSTSAPHHLSVGDTFYVGTSSNAALVGKVFTVATVVDADTITFAATAADSTNATATAERRKSCIRIDCPDWTEYRLGAYGLCVENGNLMNAAFPELTRRFVDLAMNAHLHRMSKLWIDTIATSTNSDAVTMTNVATDAPAEVLSAVGLSIADYRSEHKISGNVIIEGLFPTWLQEQFRASLAMRAGVDLMNVTDAQINAEFAARNVRPQFLEDYQALWSGSRKTAWPTTVDFIIYPAGDFVEGNGGTIDLGVVRDSRLNATNDYTAAWTEDFRLLARRGPKARKVTVPTLATDGVTACCP